MPASQQLINRKVNVIPIGNKNGVNLQFTTPDKFDPTSLEVFLSGLFLDSEDINIIDDQTFEIVIQPSNPSKLNCPPQQFEPLKVNYVVC